MPKPRVRGDRQHLLTGHQLGAAARTVICLAALIAAWLLLTGQLASS